MLENEQDYLKKKAFEKDNSNWEEEEFYFITDKFNNQVKISRLIHKLDKKNNVKHPRRLIAISKKNKSVGIDMESVFGLTAQMRLLAEKYVPDKLK